jgi:hypothetical protein
MADISDVEEAMSDALTSVLYPGGTSQSSIVGMLCRVYRGWPNAPTLNADLTDGVVNITVVTDNNSGATTTRYLPEWHTAWVSPGVTAGTDGQTISISGSPIVGDLVGILIDRSTYTYRIKEGDTPDQIAANIALAIKSIRPAINHGRSITVPDATGIAVRVVCDNRSTFESRRQEKNVRVICWCPSPLVRDSVAAAIDHALDQVDFLPLSDDTQARVVYRNTESYDQAQNALLYRRDLVYAIEYPSVIILQLPSMLFGASDTNGNILYG